jgi:hypothetical protein
MWVGGVGNRKWVGSRVWNLVKWKRKVYDVERFGRRWAGMVWAVAGVG